MIIGKILFLVLSEDDDDDMQKIHYTWRGRRYYN